MTDYNATYTPADFHIGDRIELHPGLDTWMMGDRYGTVEKIARPFVYVRMDRSRKVRKVHPSNLGHVG